MRPDSVEVSWESEKSKWLVRIVNGDEVIRRRFDARRDADDQTLRAAAQKTVQDEGYDADPSLISLRK